MLKLCEVLKIPKAIQKSKELKNSEKSDKIILEILKIPKVQKFLEALKIMKIPKSLTSQENKKYPIYSLTIKVGGFDQLFRNPPSKPSNC